MDLIYIPSLKFREFEKFEKKKSLNNFESSVQKEEKHREIARNNDSSKLEANCEFNNNQPGTG